MIKSQGVFSATNNSQSIYLDSADLRYLVSEIDDLESWYRRAIAEAQMPNNARIEYMFHQHSSACYTNPIYHRHVDSCYGPSHECGCTNYVQGAFLGNHAIDGYPMWACANCGHNSAAHGSRCTSNGGRPLICGKTTETIDGYGLGCGKTTETIEKAIITYE